jgi:hypothetical protein
MLEFIIAQTIDRLVTSLVQSLHRMDPILDWGDPHIQQSQRPAWTSPVHAISIIRNSDYGGLATSFFIC